MSDEIDPNSITVKDLNGLHVHKQYGRLNLRPGYCAHGVHDGGRSVGFHQCGHKAKFTIAGFGYCGRHYKAVQEDVARERRNSARREAWEKNNATARRRDDGPDENG